MVVTSNLLSWRRNPRPTTTRLQGNRAPALRASRPQGLYPGGSFPEVGAALCRYVGGGDGLDGREANGDVPGELALGPKGVGPGQRLAAGARPNRSLGRGPLGTDEVCGYRYGVLDVYTKFWRRAARGIPICGLFVV